MTTPTSDEPVPDNGLGIATETLSAQAAMYAEMAAMDNQDEPLENYPDRLIKALSIAGFAIVPAALPYEALGAAAMSGVLETGNPKHCWDYLLCRVRVYPSSPRPSLERTFRREPA